MVDDVHIKVATNNNWSCVICACFYSMFTSCLLRETLKTLKFKKI